MSLTEFTGLTSFGTGLNVALTGIQGVYYTAIGF